MPQENLVLTSNSRHFLIVVVTEILTFLLKTLNRYEFQPELSLGDAFGEYTYIKEARATRLNLEQAMEPI